MHNMMSLPDEELGECGPVRVLLYALPHGLIAEHVEGAKLLAQRPQDAHHALAEAAARSIWRALQPFGKLWQSASDAHLIKTAHTNMLLMHKRMQYQGAAPRVCCGITETSCCHPQHTCRPSTFMNSMTGCSLTSALRRCSRGCCGAAAAFSGGTAAAAGAALAGADAPFCASRPPKCRCTACVRAAASAPSTASITFLSCSPAVPVAAYICELAEHHHVLK